MAVKDLLWSLPVRARFITICDQHSGQFHPIVILHQRSLLLSLAAWLIVSTGCSMAPSSVTVLGTDEEPSDETYAGRQHLPVTPEEAVAYLINAAPPQGWAVVGTGEEYDAHGVRGQFFRLAPLPGGEGKQPISGVFYAEPSGSYVRISEHNGLPEPLLAPLITAIKQDKGCG